MPLMPNLNSNVRRLCLTTFALAVLFAAVVIAQRPAQPKRTGLFGKLQYHKESGDVNGLEVFVMYSRRGYVATIQVAEGEPDVPRVVDVSLIGNNISFAFPYANKK